MNDQLLGRLFEKAEMDTAIDAHLLEVRMGSEVIVLSVLKHEQTVGGQQAVSKDEVGKLGQTLQGVGRIGKDDVERSGSPFDVLEHVGLQWLPCLITQFFLYLINISIVAEVLFDRDNLSRTT